MMLKTMKIKISFSKGDKYIDSKGEYIKISELIKSTGFSMPCGGKGTCLKCKVTARGDLSPLTLVEKQNLTEGEINKNIRLACQSEIKSGEIILDDRYDVRAITEGVNPVINKTGFGIAVDIGTTTIAGYLVNMENSDIIKSISRTNILISYGADVISRIEYGVNNGTDKMSFELQNQIKGILSELEFNGEEEIVITGNTVMLSILFNLPLKGFAMYPFNPPSLFGREYDLNGKTVYVPPCISEFVGADITCSVLSSNMLKSNKNSILFDMGTNGEIVLKKDNEIYCTSVAAGPAFEGGNITMGIGGIDGAVDKVYFQGANVYFSTVNGKKPVGICGSGLIDFIAKLVTYNVIDKDGNINADNSFYAHLTEGDKLYLGNSGIYITLNDIREFQLAKSAVISGMTTLMHLSHTKTDDIDTVYISGGFGSYINTDNACDIGLIPFEFKDKIKVIGNGAGMGAIALLDKDIRNFPTEKFTVANLGSDDFFQQEFIKNLQFGKL